MKIIKRYPSGVLVRANWVHIQRALADRSKARSERFKHVNMNGESNLLFTGAKAICKSTNGIWLIYGYAADGSDVDLVLKEMQQSWTMRVIDQAAA